MQLKWKILLMLQRKIAKKISQYADARQNIHEQVKTHQKIEPSLAMKLVVHSFLGVKFATAAV